MDTKQNLATLIDAYADAKKTGNETLMRLAASPLQEFLAGHEIIPIPQPSQKVEETE